VFDKYLKMEIDNLPEEYKRIWEESLPLLARGRPGDDMHAKEVAEYLLDYSGELKIDKAVLIPVAIMHDIGHSSILPEHFKFVTGEEKLINAKLVHMLVGAKIAKDILEKVGYDKEKASEIVDIISVHDADQMKGIELEKFYDSENKKVFHDIDCLDRYTKERFGSLKKAFPSKDENYIIGLIKKRSG